MLYYYFKVKITKTHQVISGRRTVSSSISSEKLDLEMIGIILQLLQLLTETLFDVDVGSDGPSVYFFVFMRRAKTTKSSSLLYGSILLSIVDRKIH